MAGAPVQYITVFPRSHGTNSVCRSLAANLSLTQALQEYQTILSLETCNTLPVIVSVLTSGNGSNPFLNLIQARIDAAEGTVHGMRTSTYQVTGEEAIPEEVISAKSVSKSFEKNIEVTIRNRYMNPDSQLQMSGTATYPLPQAVMKYTNEVLKAPIATSRLMLLSQQLCIYIVQFCPGFSFSLHSSKGGNTSYLQRDTRMPQELDVRQRDITNHHYIEMQRLHRCSTS